MKTNKLLVLAIALLTAASTNLTAQTPAATIGETHFGISGGIGLVSPKTANSIIERHYDVKANILISWNLELNYGYFVTENIELKGAVVGAVAISAVETKDMIGMSNYSINTMYRLAPEILANYHYPLDAYRTVYGGGGISFNKIGFNIDEMDYGSSKLTPGVRLNVGLITQNERNQKYLEIKFDLARADNNYYNFSGISLNYGIKF